MKYRSEQLADQIVHLANTTLKTRVEIPPDLLITVVGCTFSQDRREAILSVSVLPDEKRGTGLRLVRAITGVLRTSLGKLFAMKRTPMITVRLAEVDWYEKHYERE